MELCRKNLWKGNPAMTDEHDPAMPEGAIPVGPVEYWAALGDLEQTLQAIQDGSDVNAVSAGNHSALHGAATNGHIDVVELLLEHGADPTIRLVSGETPADLASMAGHNDLGQRLA